MSFVGTFFSNIAGLRHSVTVGVVSDPENIETFDSVTTVDVTGFMKLDEYIVSFKDYEGEGRHIVLLSRFAEQNQVVIDDVRVYRRGALSKPNVRVQLPSATEMGIVCDGAETGIEVMLTDSVLRNTDEPDEARVMVRKTFAAQDEKVVEVKPFTGYWVYVRKVNGEEKGMWTLSQRVLTPGRIESVPQVVDFEIKKEVAPGRKDYDMSKCYEPWAYRGFNQKLCNGFLTYSNASYPAYVSDSYQGSSYNNRLAQMSDGELCVSTDIAGQTAIAVFPEVERLKQLRVGFYSAKHHPTDFCQYEVGVMSDAADPESFVSVMTIVPEFKYKYYIVDFEEYEGDGKFLAVKVVRTGDQPGRYNRAYIDNLTIEEVPMCMEPENVQIEAGATEAEITWDANGMKLWNVLVTDKDLLYDSLNSKTYTVPAGNVRFRGTTGVDENRIEVTGLKPRKARHYCYIQPVCDGETGRWAPAVEFETECPESETLPYEMKFDANASGEEYPTSMYNPEFEVECMYSKKSMWSSYGLMYYTPYLSINYKRSGKNALYMERSTQKDKEHDSYVAFPQMVEEVKETQITFWMWVDNLEKSVDVGVMSDPMDTSTFELYETVEPDKTREFMQYTVAFGRYEGQGRHIAIRMGRDTLTSGISNVYIDDVVIDKKADCGTVKKPRIYSLTPSSAELIWDSDEGAPWEVVVSTKQLGASALSNPVTGGDIVHVNQNVTAKPYEVTGLADNTVYYFYVRAVCSETVKGAWSIAGTFRTQCALLDAGELGTESFEAYGVGMGKAPSCYFVGNKSAKENLSSIPYCSNAYRHNGVASLMINSTTAANGAYAITPAIDIEDISKLRVSFYGTALNNTNDAFARKLIVGVVTDPTDLSTYVPVDTVDFVGIEQYYEVNLSDYTFDVNGDKGKHVMFSSEFAMDNSVYIDDVTFDTIGECVQPRVHVADVTDRSAEVNIVGGKAPYTVLICKRPLKQEELDTVSATSPIVTVKRVEEATLPIEGLQRVTQYYVYAKSDCEGAVWSNVKEISTLCPNEVDVTFFDDFESNAAAGPNNNTPCWISMFTKKGSEFQYPHVYQSSASNKTVYVYAENETQQSYLVSPVLNTPNLSKCQVSFYAKTDVASDLNGEQQRSIIVGVPGEGAQTDAFVKFTPIDTIIVKGTGVRTKYTVSLEKYEGSAKRILFTTAYTSNIAVKKPQLRYTKGGYYIDEVEIALVPSCPKPDFFELMTYSDTEIKLSFTNVADAPSFEVQYGPTGFAIGDGTVKEFTDTVCTIGGLEQKTSYDVYVRSVCTAEDKSEWAFAGNYHTAPKTVTTFPFKNGFETEEEIEMWNFACGTSVNAWYVGEAHPKTGAKSMYISKDKGVSADYIPEMTDGLNPESYSWAYVPVVLKEGVYTLEFDWTCFGEMMSDYMRIGLLPVTSTFGTSNEVVTDKEGTIKYLTHLANGGPTGWLEAYPIAKAEKPIFNGVDTTKTPEEQWVHNSKRFVITKELANCYNLVFYWKNDRGQGKVRHTSPSAVIDNVSIEKSTCNMPVDMEATEMTDTSAMISWSPLGDMVDVEYKIAVYDSLVDPVKAEAKHLVGVDTVSGTSLKVDTLQENTTYYVYVQTLCSEDDNSYWTEALTFETRCTPTATGVVFDFDTPENLYYREFEDGRENKVYLTPECFETYHTTLPYTQYTPSWYPYVKTSTNYNTVSRSGANALHLQSTGAQYAGGYIVLPTVDGELKEMQVSFWMRVINHNATTQKIGNLFQLDDKHTKSVVVGTMTDPADASTFKPLQVVTYPLTSLDLTSTTLVADDPMREEYWRKFTVSLEKAEGEFVAIMNEVQGDIVKNNVYIDDIQYMPISHCQVPYDVKVDDVTNESAHIAFEHNDGKEWVVMVSDKNMSDTIAIDTISVPECEVNGLPANELLLVSVRQICEKGLDESEWTVPVSFMTPNKVRFAEGFDREIVCPSDWSRARGPRIADVLDGDMPLQMQEPTDVNWGWMWRETPYTEGTFASNHISTYVAGVTTFWLISPLVMLPDDGSKLHLTFDVALTNQGEVTSPSVFDNADDKFVVVVSEDGGVTWKRGNATLWANDGTGKYVYNDIPCTGRRYEVDLSKYAGKTVKIGFAAESTMPNLSHELRMDNVAVNRWEEMPVVASRCESEDYRDSNFEIIDSELQVGDDNHFENLKLSQTDAPDVLYTADITVTAMVETVIEDKICEGREYDKHGFKVSEGGEFRQKHRAGNGCDSVVTLKLTMQPTVRVAVYDTICQGGSVVWNGEKYDRAGTYDYTTDSKVTECDSVTTLVLAVREYLRGHEKKEVCYGEEFEFGSYGVITQSGTYYDTIKTDGCDSILTMEVVLLPDFRKTITGVICSGTTYDQNGFSGINKSGVWVLPKRSEGGCDSTVTLDLIVIDGEETAVMLEIEQDELPYHFADTVFGADTEEGVYRVVRDVTSDDGSCQSRVTLTLTVGEAEPLGVDNAEVGELMLAPVPLRSGQELMISADFAAGDFEGMLLEVFDVSGRCVLYDAECEPAGGTLSVRYSEFPVSGVYFVRVTTDDGRVYKGKVIVE